MNTTDTMVTKNSSLEAFRVTGIPNLVFNIMNGEQAFADTFSEIKNKLPIQRETYIEVVLFILIPEYRQSNATLLYRSSIMSFHILGFQVIGIVRFFLVTFYLFAP